MKLANQGDFNKKALRKLTEQYLTSTILQEDIIKFLEKNVDTKRSISNVLAERAGKATNTVYKNINNLELYNAISLLRYWKALVDICREHKIKEIEIPNLNSLLSNYEGILNFLNHITTEDEIETLIDAHLNALLQIITFYKSHSTSITEEELKLLQQLETYPTINQAFEKRKQEHKSVLRERMNRK